MDEILDTRGFYRVDPNDSEALQYAPTFVYAPDYTLKIEDVASYTFPIEGWSLFATAEEAYSFFGVVPPSPDSL